MSGQLLRKFAYQARGLSVVLANTVLTQGFHRPVSVIDPTIKEDVAKRPKPSGTCSTLCPRTSSLKLVQFRLRMSSRIYGFMIPISYFDSGL